MAYSISTGIMKIWRACSVTRRHSAPRNSDMSAVAGKRKAKISVWRGVTDIMRGVASMVKRRQSSSESKHEKQRKTFCGDKRGDGIEGENIGAQSGAPASIMKIANGNNSVSNIAASAAAMTSAAASAHHRAWHSKHIRRQRKWRRKHQRQS